MLPYSSTKRTPVEGIGDWIVNAKRFATSLAGALPPTLKADSTARYTNNGPGYRLGSSSDNNGCSRGISPCHSRQSDTRRHPGDDWSRCYLCRCCCRRMARCHSISCRTSLQTRGLSKRPIETESTRSRHCRTSTAQTALITVSTTTEWSPPTH
jgi:hypothetical protein